MDGHDFMLVIRNHWRVVLASTTVVVAANLFITLMSTPMYQSDTRIFVSTTNQAAADPLQAGSFAIQRVSTYATLVTGRELALRVIDRLDLDMSPAEVSSEITAVAIPNTVLLQISARDANAQQAQQLSNTAAEQLIILVSEVETPPGKGKPMVRTSIIDPADLPVTPISPNVTRNAIVALLVGVGLGVIAAFARQQREGRPAVSRSGSERTTP